MQLHILNRWAQAADSEKLIDKFYETQLQLTVDLNTEIQKSGLHSSRMRPGVVSNSVSTRGLIFG